jgi:hypothetical protein
MQGLEQLVVKHQSDALIETEIGFGFLVPLTKVEAFIKSRF